MRDRLPMIVSITALLIALFGITPLGEAAYEAVVPRNSVGTLQLQRNAVKAAKIAPNAIRTGHVLDGSLLAADFKAGQIPQGPKGDKGDKGVPGNPGTPGAAGMSGLVRVTATNTGGASSTSPRMASASCPTGKKLLGGGAFVNVVDQAAPIALRRSNPVGESWVAHAYETSATSVSWSLSVALICATASP